MRHQIRFIGPNLLALILISACTHLPSTSKAEDSPQIDASEVVIRAQTADESFEYLMYLYGKMSFYQQHGYQVSLPTHPSFQNISTATMTDSEISDLKNIFTNEVYNIHDFAKGLAALEKYHETIQNAVARLLELHESWGFKVFPQYQVQLTLYGPGGSYNYEDGTIIMLTRPDGTFKREPPYQTVIHEIVHIGIEETIVQHYQLSHPDKEHLVDLICSIYFADLMPYYRMQDMGSPEMDPYVTSETLKSLPASIEAYVNAK